MNDWELLIKLIIPAILLIFWALSNLFNRDAAVKDGSGRPTLGPRPSAYPGRTEGPADRVADDVATAVRPAVARGRDGHPGRDPAAPARPPAATQAGTAPSGRAGPGGPQAARGRRRRANASRSAGGCSTDVNQALPTSIDLRPLSQSIADARVDAASASTFGPPSPSAAAPRPSPTSTPS